MLPGFVSVKHWPISELGVPQMLEAGISTYLSHLSAKAHLKKKYPDRQAKTESTICLFKNTSTINLFCHLLVRSKVNPKSAQASSPHKWRGPFSCSQQHTYFMGSGPQTALWLKWHGTFQARLARDSLRHTANTQAQMRISGCTAACCYPPYSFGSFGPFRLFVTCINVSEQQFCNPGKGH